MELVLKKNVKILPFLFRLFRQSKPFMLVYLETSTDGDLASTNDMSHDHRVVKERNEGLTYRHPSDRSTPTTLVRHVDRAFRPNCWYWSSPPSLRPRSPAAEYRCDSGFYICR